MPRVSDRSHKIAHSPIRALVPYADAAKSRGIHVFHLNIGQPDIHTPREAIESMHQYEESIVAYGASEGKKSLRLALQDYYNERVAPVELEDICVTTGASEAILFALFSCFDPGDEIIIPEPFYANYIGFAQMTGVKMIPVTSYIDQDFSLPSPEDFISRINSSTRAIFLCNPGNPTGNLYSEKELRKLAEIVLANDLFLIVDEVYREFCYDQPFYSILQLDELKQNAVVIDSISKVFSACGARIGFIVSRNRELLRSLLKIAQLRLCPPALGQTLAEACFKNRSDYIRNVREEYNKRRLYLYQRLSLIPGVKCYMPKAAFYIMTELPVDSAENYCKWLLSDFSYKGSTVMLAPGNGFYMNSEIGRKQVRIAFILDCEALEKAMDCIEISLQLYPGSEIRSQSERLSEIKI